MNDIISASFRIATPIMLAAVGGLLCFRAGVFNIGLEGLMLVGSFAGVAGVILGGGSVYVGFLVAILAGILMAALFALASVKLHANEIVVSLAINMLALVNNQSQPKILSLRHIIDEYHDRRAAARHHQQIDRI